MKKMHLKIPVRFTNIYQWILYTCNGLLIPGPYNEPSKESLIGINVGVYEISKTLLKRFEGHVRPYLYEDHLLVWQTEKMKYTYSRIALFWRLMKFLN